MRWPLCAVSPPLCAPLSTSLSSFPCCFVGARVQVLANRKRLLEKLPELKKSLDAIDALLAKRGSGEVVAADFELAEGIYAKAHMQVSRMHFKHHLGSLVWCSCALGNL